MSYNILLTSTSFQDTPGAHQELLAKQGYNIQILRGPLKEDVLLDIIDQYDGIICGDDEITRAVIAKGVSGKLRIISKYGIGLDKVDLTAANEFNIPVTNCPGVNQVTVAEHVFALLLTYIKNIIPEHEAVQNQQWIRYIGKELSGKTLGVLGTGNVGKEVIKRALAFGMNVLAFDKFRDEAFASKYEITYFDNANDVIKNSDIISLNLSLNAASSNIIGNQVLSILKKGVIIVNTARAGLVDSQVILEGIDKGIIGGYLTDVLEEEPIVPNHPFLGNNKIIITPHIGSRTYENVVNQGTMAVENLVKYIS
ncbi:MAG: NAD(P)-binding domain-containing protein [Hydrotalea sp.]|nr:NAD(P)-binding domain-containing protein [Hydrotalea sp.]